MPDFKIHKKGEFNYVAEDIKPEEGPKKEDIAETDKVEDYTDLLNNLLDNNKIQEFKGDGWDENGNGLFAVRVGEVWHKKLSHKQTRELLEKISKDN